MILSRQWIDEFYDYHKHSNYVLGIIAFQFVTGALSLMFYMVYLHGKPSNIPWLYTYTVYFAQYWPYFLASFIIGDICMYKAGNGYDKRNYDAVRFYGLLSAIFSTLGVLFVVYIPILFLDICFGLYTIILAIFRKFIKWVNTEPKPKNKPSSKSTIKCYDDLLKNKKRYY